MQMKIIMVCPKCENDRFIYTDLEEYVCTNCNEMFEEYELDTEKILIQSEPTNI